MLMSLLYIYLDTLRDSHEALTCIFNINYLGGTQLEFLKILYIFRNSYKYYIFSIKTLRNLFFRNSQLSLSLLYYTSGQIFIYS
jgi:hypothetical protein